MNRFQAIILLLLATWGLSACNGDAEYQNELREERFYRENEYEEESFFDLFRNQHGPEQGVAVNRYLWQASLDVLSFLPVETADPFSGLILTGWGSVSGAGTYKATILITDPALDARSLKVAAFRSQGGRAVPVSDEQNRQLEDAILTRARELRIEDFEIDG
ncbi:DUF3576 domain-containing protein [Amaricoccus tamworthensis]|uniref:DUF3576 domain-containing protein n=1 Tax=Amaricoccus tamworthensis TaxID=57002 RepID=UPI003C7AC876